MPTAHIALGSNLGDREANMRRALDELGRSAGVQALRASSLHETAPVGPAQPRYLNAAAEIETTLKPRELLAACQEIESALGRVRTVKWGPRTIDLDIVLYSEQIVREPDLQIPHPLMHERAFVLEPLAEIAPDAVHPVLRKTVAELLHDLRSRQEP